MVAKMMALRQTREQMMPRAGMQRVIVSSSVRRPLAERTSRMSLAMRNMRSRRSSVGLKLRFPLKDMSKTETAQRKKSKQFHATRK